MRAVPITLAAILALGACKKPDPSGAQQLVSLLLTLVATPVFYALFDDISRFVCRLFGWEAEGLAPPSLPSSVDGPIHQPEGAHAEE